MSHKTGTYSMINCHCKKRLTFAEKTCDVTFCALLKFFSKQPPLKSPKIVLPKNLQSNLPKYVMNFILDAKRIQFQQNRQKKKTENFNHVTSQNLSMVVVL